MSEEKDSVREAAVQALKSQGVKPENMSVEEYEKAVQKEMNAICVTSAYIRIAAGGK